VAELLRGLARVHDVSLLALSDGRAEDVDGAAALEAHGIPVEAVMTSPDRRRAGVQALLRRRSLHGSLVRSRRMKARVAARLAGRAVDVVQCEYSAMAAYWSAGSGVPWVLDAHNVEFRVNESLAAGSTSLAYRWYARREVRCRRREELAAWRAVDHLVAVSDVDRRIVEREAPGTRITVVPNGVDVTRLRPPIGSGDRPPRAVFVGKMDYRPNVDGVHWFVDEVLPLVRAAEPAFELVIVGRDPVPAVSALRERSGVTVTGRVADPVPFLHGAAVAVVPLRAGSGSRLKVLEALATGTPLVSTPTGVEGIDVVAARHAVLAHDARDFASAIVALLRDPVRRVELATEGRRLVEDRYSWRAAVDALLGVYERMAEKPQAAGRG
jgi:glycosyltransferase involved in cell wall biosynthesis